MSDLDTQLRSYFDANVERVTAEDVLAGRHVGDLVPEPRRDWRYSPRLAAGLGFAVTVCIVAGSLGLGLVLRSPQDTPDLGRIALGVGAGTSESTGWGLVGIAATLAAIALVFMVLAVRGARASSSRKREEKTMATTFETPEVDHKLEEAHRTNKWLIAAVAVLAVAVVVLGAWVINDLTSTNVTEVPTEISTMLDSYTASWNEYDEEAFLGHIREVDYIHSSSDGTYDAAETVTLIESFESYGTQIEVIGEGLYVGDGGIKYVVVPNRVTTMLNPDGGVGLSVFTVTEWGDDGWVVTRHAWIGESIG